MNYEVPYTREKKIKRFVNRLPMGQEDFKRLSEVYIANDHCWINNEDWDYLTEAFKDKVWAFVERLLGRPFVPDHYVKGADGMPDLVEDREYLFYKDAVWEAAELRLHTELAKLGTFDAA
jgi:hypothetical protein